MSLLEAYRRLTEDYFERAPWQQQTNCLFQQIMNGIIEILFWNAYSVLAHIWSHTSNRNPVNADLIDYATCYGHLN